ncbi:MAG: Gfo/Idh/MocA family oxidoreductase [Acidobacteriota bacterium]|nr:Gfo/Idh/MocA family oxidoreductase [Blastocatellia bacterium]MDW8413440.1 Gfo/Idh/MocA family oxidoreductase [Acidobacteriota bacterium]
MKVAVVGAGHLGKHHARIYAEMQGVELVGICDINEERGRSIAAKYGTQYYRSYQDLARLDLAAASVAVPTVEHYRVAKTLLESGVSVLIEKPITGSLQEAEELIKLAARKSLCLQVGHVERFNPAIIAARRIVTTPLFFEGHRLSAFSARSLDIDVVMDLMIHDIDIVLSMVDSPVASVQAAGIAVITNRIDIANARIEFDNGCIANLTASRISNEKLRKMRLFQPNDYISIDYVRQEAIVASLKKSEGLLEVIARHLSVEPAEPLRLELEAFLASVKDGQPPRVTGEDGKRALELALRVIEKIAEHGKKIGLAAIY